MARWGLAERGFVGWGEGCPWGHTNLPAIGGGIPAARDLLAPALIGENPLDIDRLNRLMHTALPGHPYAKSAIDVAFWDIAARTVKVPLYALLGGAEGAGPRNHRGTIVLADESGTGVEPPLRRAWSRPH
ncbi:MAG: hypothetical protein ACR2RL_15650 [Gammaproteobacteria bacterium]